MIYFKTFIMVVVSVLYAVAQVPFAQVNQTPLLLNASLAGAKNKHRIALAYNTTNDVEEHQYKNYHVSYDRFFKKMKAGIGMYYLVSEKMSNPIDAEWVGSLPSKVLSHDFTTVQKQHRAGVCFAPKMNISDKTNEQIIRYTFSPSLFVEYHLGQGKVNDFFQSQQYYRRNYTVDNPSGVQSNIDSTAIQFFKNSIDFRQIRTGVGFQLNSQKLLLLMSIQHETSIVNEDKQFVHHQIPSFRTDYSGEERSYMLFAIEETMSAGISLTISQKANMYFTPIVGIGFKQYLNSNTLHTASNQTHYQELISNHMPLNLNYAHGSANIRIKKILLGGAFTHSYQSNYYGGGIGFQTTHLKIMSHSVFGKRQFQEITLSYLID